jgi:predicted AAA+ superfamily ATPase
MVLKSEIEKSLALQRSFLNKKQEGFNRESLAKFKLSTSHILIITGVRRCGKSTLLQQISKKIKEEFIFFNFEDPRIYGFELEDFTKLDELVGDEIGYYFFDEIQNVEKWELFIRHLHDRDKRIAITGSNASLLSKELGTRLTGRNIQIELFPFSYTEYLMFLQLENNLASFNLYLEDGGFPEYIKSKHKEQLQQLFKDIVYRDIIVRHGIRQAKTLIDIALFLIANVGKEYSLNGIKNTFGVGSANSVADYIHWLEDSYVLFSMPRFSWSLKSVSINPKKIYCIDTGFAQANSLSFSEDTGRLLENCVYLALRRKYKEIYYFKEKGECDFIVKEAQDILHIIQVCAEIHPDNKAREVVGLLAAVTFFSKKEGLILTLNQEDVLMINDVKVRLLPVWKWLQNGEV